MPNYKNGKIYSIRSFLTDDIYIGSTTQPLSVKMALHRSNYRNGKYCSSCEILKHDDAYIELIEEYPCDSKEQLTKREGELIRGTRCVNKIIPGRTAKEWYEANKEAIREQTKKYRGANKEAIKQKHEEYYEANKEAIHEQQKKYREANKEAVREQKKEYYAANKEAVLEQQKKYREANKDVINQKRRERRAVKNLKEVEQAACTLQEAKQPQ